MISIEEFMIFIDSLKETTVRFNLNRSKATWHSINFKKFTANIHEYESFTEWWQSKNMTENLNNIIAKTLLEQNPPEKVKQALLFVML
jgi:hypothetical protein